MACACEKYMGKIGVCVTASEPDAIHLLKGLLNSKANSTPVIAIIGTTCSV